MRRILVLLITLLPLFAPRPAFAHAFGQLYTLPIPVSLYLFGGGAAVLVSFVFIGFFVRRGKNQLSYPTFEIPKLPFLTSGHFKFLFKILSVLILILTVISGYTGSKASTENFATLFVWIIFWLGLTYISAIFGNVWNVVNPWKVIAEFFEEIKGTEIKGVISYSGKLGYYPALVFYFTFIWLELLSNGRAVMPTTLATIVLTYTLVNFLGVILFGKNIWFRYFEFFSVFWGLISKISPIGTKNGHLIVGPPFVELLDNEAESFSLLLFILFMLSSTAFDGFRATVAWRKLDIVMTRITFSNSSYQISQSILLALSPVFFLILYFYAIGLIKTLVKTNLSFWNLAYKFAFSLIPIALAYNIAHYYTLLLVQGQSIIPVLSDPLGKGWNLLGTASYIPKVGIVGASFVWHSQVAAIIIGHIAAVYISHVIALKIFPSHKNAIVSQIPMLVLMIAYTMTGLWILSQPLTLGG